MRQKQIDLPKEIISILPRAKIHLYYAFKIFLESNKYEIGPNGKLGDDTLKYFNEESTLFLLNIMDEAIKRVYGNEPLDYVNVFKKRELAQKIKEVILEKRKITNN